jgi:DHA1 family inner membrane transport protein
LAGALGMRLGAAGPFGIATTVLGVAALTLGTRPGWFAYEMACGGVLMGWTFGIPFLFGGIARVDASGRLTTAINIIIGAGLAAGPAVGALMVDSTGHYGQVVYLTIGVMALSFVLALPMLRAGATNG